MPDMKRTPTLNNAPRSDQSQTAHSATRPNGGVERHVIWHRRVTVVRHKEGGGRRNERSPRPVHANPRADVATPSADVKRRRARIRPCQRRSGVDPQRPARLIGSEVVRQGPHDQVVERRQRAAGPQRPVAQGDDQLPDRGLAVEPQRPRDRGVRARSARRPQARTGAANPARRPARSSSTPRSRWARPSGVRTRTRTHGRRSRSDTSPECILARHSARLSPCQLTDGQVSWDRLRCGSSGDRARPPWKIGGHAHCRNRPSGDARAVVDARHRTRVDLEAQHLRAV